jgi:hypothetical protein
VNVYVETNFVFELAFQQEQLPSCEKILGICQQGGANLFLPAYSLVEPHDKLARQKASRSDLQLKLDQELKQLVRTAQYTSRINNIQDIQRLIIQSNEEEWDRFVECRRRLLEIAHVIPLTKQILEEAADCEKILDLKPPDALIYASVIAHLRDSSPTVACFLNRNSKDFDNPDIVENLRQRNCKLIARFDDGHAFIQSRTPLEQSVPDQTDDAQPPD